MDVPDGFGFFHAPKSNQDKSRNHNPNGLKSKSQILMPIQNRDLGRRQHAITQTCTIGQYIRAHLQKGKSDQKPPCGPRP